MLECVLKRATGYHDGHTITTICQELGLVDAANKPTDKGSRWLLDQIVTSCGGPSVLERIAELEADLPRVKNIEAEIARLREVITTMRAEAKTLGFDFHRIAEAVLGDIHEGEATADDVVKYQKEQHRLHNYDCDRAETAEAKVKELETLLGVEHPWSLADTIKKLAHAAKHLLHDHNCDHHGYEEIIEAVNMSGYYIAKARAAVEQLPARKD